MRGKIGVASLGLTLLAFWLGHVLSSNSTEALVFDDVAAGRQAAKSIEWRSDTRAETTPGPARAKQSVSACSVATIPNPGNSLLYFLKVVDSLLYVADGRALRIYNVRYGGTPAHLGGHFLGGGRFDVAGTMAAVTGDGALNIMDVSDPTSPSLISRTLLNLWLTDVVLVDTLAYVSARDSLLILNLADPNQPVVLSSLPGLGDTRRICLGSDAIYVCSESDGLFIVDVSDPLAPALASHPDTPSGAWDAVVSGDTLHVATYHDGAVALLVSDPATPQVLYTLPSPDARAVDREGQYLYVSGSAAGMLVYDLATAPTPPQVAAIHSPHEQVVMHIQIDPGRAYQAASNVVNILALSIQNESLCGNGIVESGEFCDDSNLVADDDCDPCCQFPAPAAVCGNGQVEYPETCDDGNLVAGDGCDALCDREQPTCGNGEVEYGEECDDGNTASFDGCASFCRIETCLITRPGDMNNSNTVTSADITLMIRYVFRGASPPLPCAAAGDVNCSGSVTAADIIALIGFVFKSGAPPCDICNQSALAASCV